MPIAKGSRLLVQVAGAVDQRWAVSEVLGLGWMGLGGAVVLPAAVAWVSALEADVLGYDLRVLAQAVHGSAHPTRSPRAPSTAVLDRLPGDLDLAG